MIAAWYTRERNGGVARSSAFGRRSSRTSATLNNQPVTQLTYDQIGNRITCNNTHYRPNACNQYEDLSYDSDGNMTMYDGWALTWNGENRLIRMIKGSAKLEFAYDYMGRRYEKKVYNNNNLTKHQRFIYDGYKLIEIRNALNNDALTHSFVWRKVPQDVPYSMKYGNTTYYYITDANKNVVCLLSNSIDAYYQYGPWGEIREIEGTAAYWNPFRFSSEFYDDETGLVYYNYRYYSPALGRWLSRDPIGEEGGMNLYAMCGNNLPNNNDFIGLWRIKSDADKNTERRIYCSDSRNDNIESLSKLVGLDYREFEKWGIIINGTKKNPCEISVPNTVYVFDLVTWIVMWNSFQIRIERILRKNGYKVVELNDPDFQEIMNTFRDQNIYGLVVIAHGDKDMKGGFLTGDDRRFVPRAILPTLNYKLGILKLFVCYTKTMQDEWQKLVSGEFYPGKTGEIYSIEAIWLDR